MPTYEYECQACAHHFEATQRITESALVECPTCHAPKLQRVISAPAFVLKGGGWYKDGYGNPNQPRTENQRIDRLSKALDDDKKKTADSSSSDSSDSSSTATASTPSTSSSSGSGNSPA